MVDTPEGAKKLARWFHGLRILPQFDLAEELIREEEGRKEERVGQLGERPCQ